MAASMGQAFAIQTFFIPVLKELPDPKKYVKYTFLAYAIGSTVYIYIGYAGLFGKKMNNTGIAGRTPVQKDPQTV